MLNLKVKAVSWIFWFDDRPFEGSVIIDEGYDREWSGTERRNGAETEARPLRLILHLFHAIAWRWLAGAGWSRSEVVGSECSVTVK